MADPTDPVVMIGGIPVVNAPQGLHADNAEPFRTLLLHAADRGQGTVVVNMTATRFCDPAGMVVLAWAHGHAVAHGGQLLMVIPASAPVLHVFALAGLDRLIPNFTRLNDALKQAQAVVPRPLHRYPLPPPDADLVDA